jgi:hypothetical protein
MAKGVLTASNVGTIVSKCWARPDKYFREGYNAYSYRQTKVLKAGRTQAEVQVCQQAGQTFVVTFTLRDDNTIAMACDCIRREADICAHRVAAAYELQQYLQLHPPLIWQDALAGAVKATRNQRKASRGSSIFVFSLQENDYYGAQISIYTVPRRSLPEELPVNGPELARAIHRAKVKDARPVYSRSDFSSVFNASPELIAAAGLVLNAGYSPVKARSIRSFRCWPAARSSSPAARILWPGRWPSATRKPRPISSASRLRMVFA